MTYSCLKHILCCYVYLSICMNNIFGSLVTYISQHGLHGEIHFRQHNSTAVEITADLQTTVQFPDQGYSWGISQFPVDYSNANPVGRCSSDKIGANLIDFDDDLGFLVLPGNGSSTWVKNNLSLTGETGIWGRSLLLTDHSRNVRVCGTITSKDNLTEHVAEARFHSTISGSVYFRWLSLPNINHYNTLIYINLFHLNGESKSDKVNQFTEQSWKIYTTDIFENDHHRSEADCNFLQDIFDPQGYEDSRALGDLNARLGNIKISTNPLHQTHQQFFSNDKLVLLPSDLTMSHRTLYLVITDVANSENFIACARIKHVHPLVYKSFLNTVGIRGDVTFTQRCMFDPTILNFTVFAASNQSKANIDYARDVASFKIHNLPPAPQMANSQRYCATTGDVFNPNSLNLKESPPPGFGTQDQYAVGDLSGKLQSRNQQYFHNYILPGNSSELNGIYWDVFLPLKGLNSVAHRGLVFYKYNRTNYPGITEDQWGCGTILPYEINGIYQKSLYTAQVLFRYPIVGRILFRQTKDDPSQDTFVIIEYLIHADGSTQNTSYSHRWAIHSDPPGRDFYNWTARCLSAGEVYNPIKVDLNLNSPGETCTTLFKDLCRLGDLWNRLGTVTIAGSRENALEISRKMFVDSNLPLSESHSILGKSVIIYDDFGPKARGERLGCSMISGHYSKKGVAKNWYPNGDEHVVKGKLEIYQQSEYDVSNIEVELKGLNDVNEFHVHMTPVEANLAFPCEKSSLYGIWNPRNINSRLSPMSGDGSTDQYQMGDFSGKFGTLDGLQNLMAAYNDSNLPLFGYESVLGRSIVIHKNDRSSRRWACSTIESGYSPNEAREIRAIASFHHPAGYAYGYIRMQQLIYPDGSSSDTILEVNLRHPGKNDRNITRTHNWQIFVNPVGVDATVKQTVTRCVAGGYVWNPYFTQLADPLNRELYVQECSPDNPLRCYVGDVSARVGQIDIGFKRVVLSDSNFPLKGSVSAIGRSIVIFGPNGSEERFACANIEPDHDLVKYINLQKPPRFVITQFLQDIRQVTSAPDWMLNIDARTVKSLHGGACIQMVMHFKGPYAHQLEIDLSGLLVAGVLYRPSVYIPGYVDQKRKTTLPYRTCEVVDPNEKKSKKTESSADRPLFTLWLLCFARVAFNV